MPSQKNNDNCKKHYRKIYNGFDITSDDIDNEIYVNSIHYYTNSTIIVSILKHKPPSLYKRVGVNISGEYGVERRGQIKTICLWKCKRRYAPTLIFRRLIILLNQTRINLKLHQPILKSNASDLTRMPIVSSKSKQYGTPK